MNQKQTELQELAIVKSLYFFEKSCAGYLNLAMRFGKVRCTLEILKRLLKNNPSVLILYPDNKLKETWKKECILWNYSNPNIIYGNYASIEKYLESEFDFLCLDEFHDCSENQRNLIRELKDRCSYILGLSGTVSQETKKLWPWMQEIHNYTTLSGISDQILADYQITVHLVNLDTTIKTPNKKGKLLTEKQKYDNYTYVIQQMKYNGQNYMHLALARNRLSLSSIGKMNYLKQLLNKLFDKRVVVFTGLADVADSVGIPSYHSKSKSDENFLDFQGEKINHLALAAMGKVGVTYPNLDSVILLNFTYNAEESSQILNRAIKLDYKGKVADLHVICLNEPAELKKAKESLSMLDQNKIKYV